MIFHGSDALVGLGLYLAVCLVTVGAGNGLLKLLRVHLEDQLRFFFAPVLTLVFWILALGLAGAAGWPLKYVCPGVWGATLVLFGYGCWSRPRLHGASLPGLLLCAALPVLGMGRAFAFGLTEYPWTLGTDGYNYVAVAQYLWDFGRNVVEGQPAFYDSGIVMMPARYISPCLLGLLSCVHESGETLYMGSFLQAVALYVTASAVFFYWRAQQRAAGFAAAATAVTLLCGWVLRTVWWSNYDNTVFLFFMPALAGVLAVMPPGNRPFQVLCGMLIAAGGYLYAECFPIGLAGALVLAVPRLWHERTQWRGWLAAGAVAGCVAVVLLLPAARLLTNFFVTQFHLANRHTGGGAGDIYFPGFQVPRRFLETVWSLSGAGASRAAEKHKWLCTAGLTVLAALGLCQLLRERRWALLLCVGFFGAGVAYLIWRTRYDYAVCNYGVFKLLNLSWWCLAALLVSGAELLMRLGRTELFRPVAQSALALAVAIYVYIAKATQPSASWLTTGAGLLAGVEWLAYCRNSRVFPALLGSALLSLGAGFAYLSQVTFPSNPGLLAQRLSDFRQTEAIRQITGDEPVVDACEDWLNCLVSRYNLRGAPVNPLLCRGAILYLTVTHPPRPCSPATRFLITDTTSVLGPYLSQTASRRAVLGSYTLWDLHHDRHGATVVAIENPYGLEGRDDGVPFWLGTGKAVVYVVAARDGDLLLDCSFIAGPSGLAEPRRTLRTSTTAGFTEQHVLGNERKPLRIPVRAGLNRVGLEALDPPVHPQALPGDPRTLMLLVILHSTRFVSAEEAVSPSEPAHTSSSTTHAPKS